MTSLRGPALARLMRPRLIGVGLALAMIITCVAAPAVEAGDGWWGALDEGEAVSLTNIMRGPRDYRGRTLTFFCLFHRKEQYFDPMRTQFSAKRYDNFSAWPDGAPVWEKKAYEEGDLPFLYIRRGHAQRDDLLRLKPFTRIEVTGRIRDLLRGRPTIEVFSYRVTGHRVGKPVVDDIMRGRNSARIGTKNGYQLAAQSLKRALTPDLAPLYAIAVRKMLADALRKLGHHAEAEAYDRGETYGTSDLPSPDAFPREPTPGDYPRPPMGPDDDLPGTPVWDRPGRVVGVGSPDDGPASSGSASGALTGSPDGESSPLPSRRADARRRSRPGLPSVPAPARTPLTRESDLPGAPRGPLTAESDLPGTPRQHAPPGRRPGTSAPNRAGALPPPAAPRLPQGSVPTSEAASSVPRGSAVGGSAGGSATPRAPVRRGPVSGIPPTRTPRLTGVR